MSQKRQIKSISFSRSLKHGVWGAGWDCGIDLRRVFVTCCDVEDQQEKDEIDVCVECSSTIKESMDYLRVWTCGS